MFRHKLSLIFRIFSCKNTEILCLIGKKLENPRLTYSDKEWLRKVGGYFG